jgi:hypothetical protein
MKSWKLFGIGKTGLIITGILLIGVAIQFYTPEIKNPLVTGRPNAPKEVMQIYERACYPCHSNETQLSWYDKIAPVSWIVSADVNEARSRFNFSQWDKLSEKEKQTILWETVNAVITGKMPLKSYTALHSSGNITAAEREVLKNYVNSLSNNRPASERAAAGNVRAAAEELVRYRQKKEQRDTIPVALNGVKYIEGYRNWQVISTTSRFDNYTMRIVYGNDIAVKAIRENRIKPFPDGATIIKVVWNKIEDKDGMVRPGTFNAVQIMIKDDKKYSKTGGWGFAIFNGQKLIPTGKTALFETTCFNCHKMGASDNGYVFNIPLKDDNAKRAMFDAGRQTVITSHLDQKQQTMSILYGNAAAYRAVLDSNGRHTSGEVFTLTTWQQVPNPHWYGSYINGRVKTVETVSILLSLRGDTLTEYKLLKGDGPRDGNGQPIDRQDRIDFVLGLKPSVFP